MVTSLVFLLFVLAFAPVIVLAIRSQMGKRVGNKEKFLSIGFSAGFSILLISVLFYSDLYTESLWFQNLGFESRYWKEIFAKWALTAVFIVACFLFLKLNCLLLKRFLAPVLKKKAGQQSFSLLADVISLTLAVIVGFISGNQWQAFLMFWNQAKTGILDPIFQKDISFYFFSLPVYDYLSNILLIFSVIFCLIFGIVYFVFPGPKNKGLPAAGSIILMEFFGAVIWKLNLAQYHILYQSRERFYGASYTDINVNLIAYKIFMLILLLGIAALVVNTFLRNWKIPAAALGVFVLALIGLGAAPAIVWKISVENTELEKELQYMANNIEFTRQAYGLGGVEEREFNLETSYEVLLQNQEQFSNIRLWDSRALISGYRQRQAIRTYYEFPGVDMDRYQINGVYRQVMLAPRELEQDKLAQTWVNKKLKFTHGYGVVLNAVNEFSVGGYPNFLVGDIPPQSKAPEIKVTRPEIYFGLLTRDYVIVKTHEGEFDYPQGDLNTFTFYQGEGGVEIGKGLRKLALALKFNDHNILLSRYLKPESRILFYRQIKERVNILAPFLTYDQDPYLVIDSEGGLWWVLDAYTTSSKYPYSQPYPLRVDAYLQKEINYIRNSVKVVINAYDGKVSFYVFDETDPIIRTWMNIFPDLFKAKDKMPASLLSHVRYPIDLLNAQAKAYCVYHVTDPQVFYNKEDIWEFGKGYYEASTDVPLPTASNLTSTPNNATAETKAPKKELLPQEIKPYYVIIRLPDNPEKEFILMLPFTPKGKDNLIGWIAGRSDSVHYGKVLVFKFSKQTLVYGPMQFEARINQNTEMSEKFGWWSREGSEVIRGNALIIPIENTLLYVEPVYLKSTTSEMPEIKKIIVAMGDKLEWGDSFSEAIKKILPTQAQTLEEIAMSAQKHFAEYQRLTSEGKLNEAGSALEKLREALQQIYDLVEKLKTEIK